MNNLIGKQILTMRKLYSVGSKFDNMSNGEIVGTTFNNLTGKTELTVKIGDTYIPGVPANYVRLLDDVDMAENVGELFYITAEYSDINCHLDQHDIVRVVGITQDGRYQIADTLENYLTEIPANYLELYVDDPFYDQD